MKVLPFDPSFGLSPELQIEGYTIVRDSGVGTPGRDIILAPLGTSEINASSGDDIIVALSGDQTIYAGSGNDVVFASWDGRKTIYLNDSSGTSSVQELLQQTDPERIEPLDERAFTVDQVLRVYRLLYGENDPWLTKFLELGGRVEAVEGDGNPFTDSDWDCQENSNGLLRPVVQVQFSLESPIEAATHVRRQMLSACERAAFSICDLGYRMEAELSGALFTSALAQEHATFEDSLDTYDELRAAAFDNAVAATSAISNVYISSVGIVSEGADIVMALSDVSQGQYASAVAFLPFVSATMVNSYRVILRAADGSELVRKVGEVVHHFPEGVSDIGWIVRRNVALDVGPLVNGNRTWLVGTPQVAGSGHADQCRLLGSNAASLGDAEYVVYNRSLHTGTAIDADDLVVLVDGQLINVSGWRPDVLVVRRGPDGKPKIDLYEVQSPPPDQTEPQLLIKLQQMMQALPQDIRGDIDVIPYPYP